MAARVRGSMQKLGFCPAEEEFSRYPPLRNMEAFMGASGFKASGML